MAVDPSEPVEIPIDGTLDLHTFHPRDTKDLVRDYIDACLESGIRDVRIIHGKGTGALRRTVHATLNKNPAVESYHLSGEDGGSWGATLVTLTRKVPDLQLVNFLKASERILAFVGAGISTSSGIPDFRGPQGTWTKRRPIYYQDFMTSESARSEYWQQKLEDWELIREAQPNAVHKALVRLEEAGKLEMLVSQNIDGLHLKAGTSFERLVELHGTVSQVECQSCGARSDPEPHLDAFRKDKVAPDCSCDGYLKSATISFGQNLKEADLQRAAAAAEKADSVFALGSTLSVTPAASFPLVAAQRGVPYIIINKGPTEHDREPNVSLRLEGDVTQIFPPAVEVALQGDAARYSS